MTIKAIILDVSDTMLRRGKSLRIVDEITEMIAQLRKRNISLFTASNNVYEANAVKGRLDIDKGNILHSGMREIDGKKGSKKFRLCCKNI